MPDHGPDRSPDLSPDLSTVQTARDLVAPIGYLGGRWMSARDTFARGEQRGVAGFAFYFVGRGSALGDVSGEIVASVMTFFPRDVVCALWSQGRSVLAPPDALATFSECCWDWGRTHLASVPAGQLQRAALLLAQVVDDVDGAALPLFAGWRNVPRPSDGPALVTHLLHVFRELRGALHAVAVVASGLAPIEAIVASAPTSGFGSPQSLGWSEPLPVPSDQVRGRRQAAEDLTDELVARALAVLSESERMELTRCVAELREAAKIG